ncbi:MAG: hypothetical protein ACOC6G_02090 [Thermoproteota archaeon]
MGRFTINVDDDLDVQFRVKAVKRKLKLKEAFEQAMRLWLKKDCEE